MTPATPFALGPQATLAMPEARIVLPAVRVYDIEGGQHPLPAQGCSHLPLKLTVGPGAELRLDRAFRRRKISRRLRGEDIHGAEERRTAVEG